VVVAIIAILASILLPSLGRARELARQSVCKANLNGMGKAIKLYMADDPEKEPTPRLVDDGAAEAAMTDADDNDEIFTTVTAADGTVTITLNLGESAMQNIWLLIKQGLLDETVTRCPSDPLWKSRPTTAERFGWTDPDQVSYGLHFPYAENAAGTENDYPLDKNLDGDMVIMADQHPDPTGGLGVDNTAGAEISPSNHPKDGEGILRFNASVSWYAKKDSNNIPEDSLAGKFEDDIYTAEGAGIPDAGADPADPTYDTYIVPNK